MDFKVNVNKLFFFSFSLSIIFNAQTLRIEMTAGNILILFCSTIFPDRIHLFGCVYKFSFQFPF